ncbi:hypothetical protein EHS25_009934 [Saitozyma podzolica]|uniref:Uncharacterized protein n=1 Tax=Saitozyma podzolica TaxID=1890683 RepID=A0A427YI47_9TREE|nr:hypothetical protein EHS25_009934 [Saitozyma podzolica]
MPAFPIPALPSLDSFRSFINTSPPVFYPAEAANHVRPTRERRRSDHTTRPPSRSETGSGSGSHEPGRSRSRSTTGVAGVDSPLRRPRPEESGPSHTHAHTHTHARAPSSSSGTLMPANASAIDMDLSGDWEPLSLPPVAGGHLTRRNSTGARAQPDITNALSLSFDPIPPLRAPSGCSSSPGRPGHRRSHSAAPTTTPAFAPPPVPPPSTRRTYAPFGRLREFSRNPLASTSAVSLPTLVELDGPNHDVSSSNDTIETMSERGSPLVRPRNRRLSKASAISPASPLIPARSPPMSPLSVSDFALPSIDSSDSDESEESRPLSGPSSSSSSETRTGTGTGTSEAWQASSVPPPQAVGRMRPRPPARSWSQDIVDLRPNNTDPLSLFASSMTPGHGHGRRHSVTAASSSVSNVAVLANWSFPSPPDRQPVPTSDTANPLSEPVRGRSPDHASRRLRERLRTLSQLDTTVLPGPEPLAGSGSKRPDVARSNTTAQLQSQSPFQIPSIQSLPPTGPRAAVTPQGDRGDGGDRVDRSSGLSLAVRLELSRSRANTLSFSPGSLTDDSTSTSSILCPSPTASIVSLPPPPLHLERDIHPGSISASATVALATRDDKEVWWKRWGSRRRSLADHAVSTLKTSIEADIARLGINDVDLDASPKITEDDGDGDEDLGIDTQISLEEQFLDFDDI